MNENHAEVPAALQHIIPLEAWQRWSIAQRAYVIEHEGAATNHVMNADYRAKTWELDHARPHYGERCSKCLFEYCFYAMPRNWSLSHSADVWNLMKCANVNCQHYFESCL